jgi:phage tail sheath protein FI
MPEYLAPGVYVEEVEIGAKPIEGVSTSTAGFLGPTERGPTNPKLVTNFADFQKKYGGFVEGSYLAYAVDGFFRNGGQRCFIGRVTSADARVATASLGRKDESGADQAVIELAAVGPGSWGNNIAVEVAKATLDKEGEKKRFKLTVKYWKTAPSAKEATPTPKPKPTDKPKPADRGTSAKESATAAWGEPDVVELYDNLSSLESSSEFYEKRINGISQLITVQKTGDGRPDDTSAEIRLAGGTKDNTKLPSAVDYGGVAETGKRTGLAAFEEIDEISIVCVPDCAPADGAQDALTGKIVNHCETLKDRFAILQAGKGTSEIEKLWPPLDTKYAAFYYPYINVLDPLTGVKKLVPPGGHIAGIYARSDTERGVHKAPANEVVRGALGLEFALTKQQQDILNPRGVNCVRAFRGRGIRVWGARAASSDPLWKYVNVRRLFLYLEESIEDGTQWVVFEPNDQTLWARVRQTISQFLTRVWKDGALMGTTPDEAFFVKCDRTTMTQDDIDNGRLIVLIGVAPVKPAEFVIFRIAQWPGGSEVSE